MCPEELISILAKLRRQLHHTDRKPRLRHQLGVLLDRLDTGLVCVPDDRDPFGPGFQQVDLVLSQSRSARSHGILHPDLVQPAYVQIALDKVSLLRGVDLHIRLEPPEKDSLLLVQFSLPGVQVLGNARLVTDVPSGKTRYVAACPEHRKHYPVPERVIDLPGVLVPLDQSCRKQHVLLPSKSRQVLFQASFLWSVADAEQLGGLGFDPALLQDIFLGSR